MEKLLLTTYRWLAAAALAAALLAMASCQGAGEPEQGPGTAIGVGPAGPGLDWELGRASRDEDPAEKYPFCVKAVTPDEIGLFGSQQGVGSAVFNNQRAYYRNGRHPGLTDEEFAAMLVGWPDNNDWPYAPKKYWSENSTAKYQFYAYSPCEPDNVMLTAISYGHMQTMTWRKLQPFSNTDHMVAASVASRNCGVMPVFDMLHLNARIAFRFIVGEEYSKLREIHITRMEVEDYENATDYYATVSISSDPGTPSTFALNSDGAHEKGIVILLDESDEYVWADEPELGKVVADPDQRPGLRLYADRYKLYSSLYVMPLRIFSLTCHVTYDVYDKEGQLVRKDCRATSVIDIGGADGIICEAGKFYVVNIAVSPRYLYVLSDNDLVPDGLVDVDD